MARTTKNLISEVRSLLDEVNEAELSDSSDLLPSLNRGYDYGLRTLASHYVAPLLVHSEITLEGGVSDYDIPKDAFEDRLLKIEVNNNGFFTEVQRIDYKDISAYDTPARLSSPFYYCIVGTKYRLVPAPTATYPLRIWYAGHPGPLVEEQGSIGVVNTASNYIVVDEAGSDLSSSGMSAYVNIVDGDTGTVKATMQLQSVTGNKLTFKSSPDRSVVYGRSVSSSMPDTISKDDLVCSAEGSAIPVLRSTMSNFLVQFCVAEMTRKLGGDPSVEEKIKDDFETQLKQAWAGRERYTRVKKQNKWFGQSGRRIWPVSRN